MNTFFFCHYVSVYAWWGSLHHLCFICSHIKHCYLPRTYYVRYISYVPESVTAVNDTRSYIGRSSGLFILIKAASLFFITGLLMKVIVKTVVMASR